MKNNYLYNDKELWDDADLDWYDYGFRNYDPQIGRFPQLDPLTDDYPELTPYQYASDEPVANVDMDGLERASSIGDFTYNVASKSNLVLGHISQVSTELTKTASHIIPIAIQGIHLAVDIVQNQINNKSLNKNASAELSKNITDYYLAHKHEMSFTDFLALNSLANNYYKGLNCMAWWAKGDFLKLNRAVINSTLPDELKVQLVELGIEDSQEGWHSIFRSGADVGIFISGLALFPEVGMGPKGSMLKFRTSPMTAEKLKPLGLGSTGRTVPSNLSEQFAMEEAMSNPAAGQIIQRMKPINDSRWLGWRKMQYEHIGLDGHKTVIHYNGKWIDGVLKAVDDFKFK